MVGPSTTTAGIGAQRRAGLRSLSSAWYLVALIAPVAVYYLFLLSDGTFQLFAPEMLDKVFDKFGVARDQAPHWISSPLHQPLRCPQI